MSRTRVSPHMTSGFIEANGLKYIGRAASLTELRLIEPTDPSQTISLRGLTAGSIIGAGQFSYVPSNSQPDDGYHVVVTAGGKRWVREGFHSGFVTPEDIGYATDDWSTIISQAMSFAVASGKRFCLSAGKTYHTKSGILVPQAFIDAGYVIDFNGATIQMDYVNESCFKDAAGTFGLKNISYVNGTISGIGSVDSRWNTTQYNNGLNMGDYSAMNNMRIKNIGNDAVSVPGSYVTIGSYYCTNIRDNAIASYGKYTTVQSIVVGHCAGDAVLFKSGNMTIQSFQADKAGVPGADPEPGFWAGGGIIFGSQDDVGDSLGTHNYIGYVRIRQYGALGIGMNGTDCHVGFADVGSSFYTGANEASVHGGKVFALLMHGQRNSIETFEAGDSPYGVGFTYGDGHRIGSIRIGLTKYQQFYATTNVTNLVVESMTFANGPMESTANANFLQARNSNIKHLRVNDADVAVGATGNIINSDTLSIGEFELVCKAGGRGGTYTDFRAVKIIDRFVATDCPGLALWIKPTCQAYPVHARMTNVATATRPIYQIERSAVLCGWYVQDLSGGNGGQPTFYKSGATAVVGKCAGYYGAAPLGQGGATVDFTSYNTLAGL